METLNFGDFMIKRLVFITLMAFSSMALAIPRQIIFSDAVVVLYDSPCEIGWVIAEIVKIPELNKIKSEFKHAEVTLKSGTKLKACYLEADDAIGIRDERGGATLVPADVALPLPLPKRHQSTTGS